MKSLGQIIEERGTFQDMLTDAGFTSTIAQIDAVGVLTSFTATQVAYLNVMNASLTATNFTTLYQVPATATELNKLDGVTATATELNYTNLMNATLNATDFLKLAALTATATELNKMDGVTATATELNYTNVMNASLNATDFSKLAALGAWTTGTVLNRALFAAATNYTLIAATVAVTGSATVIPAGIATLKYFYAVPIGTSTTTNKAGTTIQVKKKSATAFTVYRCGPKTTASSTAGTVAWMAIGIAT